MSFAARSLNPHLVFCVWLTANASLLALPTYAQVQPNNANLYQVKVISNSQQLAPLSIGELPPTSITTKDLLAQNTAISITGVNLNVENQGVRVILETPTGNLTVPTPQTLGKLVYFDIPNAKLSLPNAKEFQVESPAKGIANVSVS